MTANHEAATTTTPRIGTREEWLRERRALLAREKELTRAGDALARERQALPWVPLEKAYRFATPSGEATLADLFDGRSQLLVYHLMLGPDWTEACVGCSFSADGFDGAAPHLNARDVTFVSVSRAPLARIEAFRDRMGWRFPWVSSLGSDFNFDFGVSFTPEQLEAGTAEYNYRVQPSWHEESHGLSAFALRDGVVHHTYSAYYRGTEGLAPAWDLLDRAPLGRDEGDEPGAWIRLHDAYEPAAEGTDGTAGCASC